MKPILPVLTLLAAAACGSSTGEQPPGTAQPSPTADPPGTVQPGAPGEATREVAPGSTHTEDSGYTEADVAFVQTMIPHHAQALVMTALVPDRTDRRDIRLAAERIESSQITEIAQMRRWLESRGEEVPEPDATGHSGMHGMASAEDLARLDAARGETFDRLFLELMIRHHEGALQMTRELLAVEGAAEEPELFQLVSHIDADQRAEIARMRRMLSAP